MRNMLPFAASVAASLSLSSISSALPHDYKKGQQVVMNL